MQYNLAILILTFFGSIACSEKPKESADAPTTYDVVFMPTDEFPHTEAVKAASIISKDTGLQIKVVLPLGTKDWEPYPDRPQYDPIALLKLSVPVIERTRASYGGKAYIILTTRDIGPSDKSLNFVFSLNDPTNKSSIVSVARMIYNRQGEQADSNVIQSRLHKMILRSIGLQFYGLQRSADINDLMYAPLMGLDDLDRIGTTLKTE